MPSQLDSEVVVRFTERVLREGSVRAVAAALSRLRGESTCPTLFLDLADVEAPTAGGLGQLVKLHQKLRDAGRELVLVNVGARVLEVLEATGLTALLDIRPGGP
jgi:anti-anti-sigma factor